MNEANPDRFQCMVGRRIQIARKQLKMTQEQLSAELGLPARQSLSYIEDGQRKVTADELVRLIQTLKKPLEFFTDPFLLIGEAAVSWRAEEAPEALMSFESKMLPLVAVYRHLTSDLRQSQTVLVPQLPITPSSSFEEASNAAEKLVKEWGLGSIPTKNLASTAEEKLNLLVLLVDASDGISGAAVHLKDFDTIIINRKESAGRRNYDFGHELFHVLTWHSMAPPYLDAEQGKTNKQKRIEQLAQNFTSSLLMPTETVTALWKARKDCEIHAWIHDTARVLEVSGLALYWRLINLGFLSKENSEGIDRKRLSQEMDTVKPKIYSHRFVACLHAGIDKGLISVRKVASLLDCTVEDLEDLFRDYGFEPPFNL